MSDMDQSLGGLKNAAGAGVGAQLVTMRYGCDVEREADRYGMEYMPPPATTRRPPCCSRKSVALS